MLPDSVGPYDHSIHTNPDARAWVRLFREKNPECNIDDDTMAGWFANAIMAGSDHAANRSHNENRERVNEIGQKLAETALGSMRQRTRFTLLLDTAKGLRAHIQAIWSRIPDKNARLDQLASFREFVFNEASKALVESSSVNSFDHGPELIVEPAPHPESSPLSGGWVDALLNPKENPSAIADAPVGVTPPTTPDVAPSLGFWPAWNTIGKQLLRTEHQGWCGSAHYDRGLGYWEWRVGRPIGLPGSYDYLFTGKSKSANEAMSEVEKKIQALLSGEPSVIPESKLTTPCPTPPKGHGETYASVLDMVKDTADPEFAQEFEKHIHEKEESIAESESLRSRLTREITTYLSQAGSSLIFGMPARSPGSPAWSQAGPDLYRAQEGWTHAYVKKGNHGTWSWRIGILDGFPGDYATRERGCEKDRVDAMVEVEMRMRHINR